MRPNQLPQMASLDDRSVSVIPSGGINSSRLENEIDDNQLSDGLNIWYKDSLLRFRPGLIKQIEQTYGKVIETLPHDGRKLLLKKIVKDGTVTDLKYGIYIITQKAVLMFDGTSIERISDTFDMDNNFTPIYTDYNFDKIAVIDGTLTQKDDTSTSVSWSIQGSSFYIFGNGHYFNIGPQVLTWPFPVGSTTTYAGIVIKTIAYKIPTIYTNMKPSGSGDKLEARNYMTPEVWAECITDNSATVYHLPDQNIDTTIVMAEYNNLSGTTSTFEWSKSDTSVTVNNITATLDRTAGTITFSTTLTNAAAAEDKVPNLKYFYSKTVYATSPMLNCSIGALFGGSYQGQASGDCIFLSGNSSEPNAVYWSAVNDPTYFPDDCVDYVGEPSDPVTAFGKCFGVLVIFKQSSIYQKGFSWDSTTSKQYFPTEELKIGVGCDSPKSVQIVNNHLVWLSSNGGIYTIVSTSTTSSSANIYTERNIVPLSQNINKQLLVESVSDLQAAVGVDDGYYYHLFVGTHDYLWDYTTTPFINYQDTSKLQNRLAWYIWNLPKSATAAIFYSGKIWIAASDNNFLYALDPDSALDDGGAWFDAYIKSKDFDFTAPFLLKKVYYLSLTLASKGSVTALVTLTDDYGDIEQAETLEDGGDEETITTLSYNQPTGFTKKFMVSVNRMKNDNSAFAVNQITALAKIGRKV